MVVDTPAIWQDDRLAALSRQIMDETGREPAIAEAVQPILTL
jgi:hypothetical protein